MRKYLGFLLIAVLSAVFSVAIYDRIHSGDQQVIVQETQPIKIAQLGKAAIVPSDGFVEAAARSTPAVVHIKTSSTVKTARKGNSFWDFFGDEGFQPQPSIGSGSGVIISADGYIVTNNHVVEGADEIKVVLNDNREFNGTLLGRDPSTDLAVIKIDEKNLPALAFGNSDEIQIGEWVLAVGNPFNLSSTVTAGIVSAKGRNINILRERAGNVAIESFIQTDAAVNPGNSGGALVDMSGNLIGVNTAIATPTGTYAGYSFAVPSNLVKKVVRDIMDYGVVQRGFMGVSITTLSADQVRDLKLEPGEGVYISEVSRGSGAHDAGLEPGDVITHINGSRVKSSPELQELVGRYRPGDVIDVELLRGKNTLNKKVTLKTQSNSTELLSKKEVEKASDALARLGAVLEDLAPEDSRSYGIRGGVVVKKIKSGILSENTQMQPGFIITKVNNRPVYSVQELTEILEGYTGDGVLVEGLYPNQRGTKYYAFGM